MASDAKTNPPQWGKGEFKPGANVQRRTKKPPYPEHKILPSGKSDPPKTARVSGICGPVPIDNLRLTNLRLTT